MPTKKQDPLLFDYETYSELDIKVVGAYVYSKHKSTKALVLAAIYKKEKLLIYPDEGEKIPPKWMKRFLDKKIVKITHNVAFDKYIFENVHIKKKLPNTYDNMASCYYYGLAGSLENSAIMMGIEGKYKEGRLAMLKLAKNKKEDVKDYLIKLKENGKYCMADVVILKKIFDHIGFIDNQFELDLMNMTIAMNTGGLSVDLKTVKLIIKNYDTFLVKASKNVRLLTNGEFDLDGLRKHVAFNEYLYSNFDIDLPNSQKATYENFYDKYLKGKKRGFQTPKKLIEYKLLTSNTSVTKLYKILQIAFGDIVRDCLQYHGAHTARWAGRLLQPQNLPRDSFNGKDFREFLESVKKGFSLKLASDIPKAIRSFIVAKKGHVLVVADYAQIEARVLAWVAGQMSLIKQFKSGVDVYKVFGDAHKVSRKVGKTAILGLGFGMGWKKFIDTLEIQAEVIISAPASQLLVSGYRAGHPKIPLFWEAIEDLFGTVITKKKKIKVNLNTTGTSLTIDWNKKLNALTVTLPSGRTMHYYNARISNRHMIYTGVKNGQVLPINIYGGLITENIVQAIARDIMGYCLLKMKKYNPILTVHDEMIFQVKKGKDDLKKIEKDMLGVGAAPWFDTELLAVEIGKGARYGKL